MATLKVEIVTPEAPFWVGEATALAARSSDGWFTVLPEHMDMVGDVVPSIVRVGTSGGRDRRLPCTGVSSRWDLAVPGRRSLRCSRGSLKRPPTLTWRAPRRRKKRPKRNWPPKAEVSRATP